MKARDIYNTMRAIAEEHHAYTDQLIAIAKWIETEFEYKPQKLANGANTSERQLTIPDVIKSVCGWCGEKRVLNENGSCKCCVCLDDKQTVL